MVIVNHYKTKNGIIMNQRLKRYLNKSHGLYKDFRLNHVRKFKELSDDVIILQDYANQMALRSLLLRKDILLHSIYIKYPELFEY